MTFINKASKGSQSINYWVAFAYRILLAFGLLSVGRWVFYLFNREFFQNIDSDELLLIIKGGAVFDLAGFFYLNLAFLIFSLIPVPKRSSKGYQSFLKYLFLLPNSIGFFLNCMDIVNYRFTLRRTTYGVFSEFGNEANPGKFVLQFIIDFWYIAVVFGIITWLFTRLYKRVSVQPISEKGTGFYVVYTLLTLGTIYLAIGGIRGGFKHSTRPLAMTDAGQYVTNPNNMNLVLNTPFTLIRTIGKAKLREVTYFEKDELNQIYTPEHFPSDSVTAPFNKKNIVFIVLESFGKESVGFYNKSLDNNTYTGYTPFLDSLLSESKVLWNSFANGHKSIDALPALLASIPSGPQPFILTPYTINKLKGLPYLLREEGYHTSFFHGAPNGSMGFNAFTKLAGVDHYYGKNEFNDDSQFDGMWGIWDEPFFQYFAQTLNTFEQPFFSSIFSLSSHHPFKVPTAYEGVFKKGPLPVQECMGYTDMALRKFFDVAKSSDWYNNTLFVVTADHATTRTREEYLNAWGDMAIPILIFEPSNPEMKGIEEAVIQQMDLMPTLLKYLNYNKPFVAFGEDIFSPNKRNFAYNYQSGHRWVDGDHILFFDGEKTTGLFNFKEDQLMKKNLMQQDTARANSMSTTLKAFVQQYNQRLIHDQLTIQ